jgi:uncharacterized membrane protein YukC
MDKEFIQKLTILVEANLANEKFDPEEQQVEIVPKKSNQTKILIGLVAILILVISLTFFLLYHFPNSKAVKSIAVLPFEYLGTEPEKQFQADGMMSIIQSNFSKFMI